MVKPRKKSSRVDSQPVPIGDALFALLEKMGGKKERASLDALWRSWEEVVGEEIARLGTPDGYHDSTLFIAAEDAIDMQELSMQSGIILERINEFLKSEYFSSLKVRLTGSRKG